MKATLRACLITLLLLGILSSGFVNRAVATSPSQAELSARSYVLWQKINEARANPRFTMARLGIPEAQAVAVLGNDAWIIGQGLPPLAWNGQLQAAAQAHGRDMLANVYYSHISIAGLDPAARVAATGYEAVAVDETLAALDFDNYLDPDTALAALFDNMLRDELTGVVGVGRNIFSPSLTEIGIGFLAESVALLSARPNVYLLVVDFSTPASVSPVDQRPVATEAEMAAQTYLLWQKINEARANPRLTMARLGITEEQAAAVLGDDVWIIDQGLPPLAWSSQLQAAARDHGRDMFANVYYSHVSIGGLDPAARVAATGYEALDADETLAVLAFNTYLDPDTAVAGLFDNILIDELTGTPGVARNIFSVSCTEIGLDIQAESVPSLAGNPYVYLLVLNVAQPLVPRFFVVGMVDAGRQVLQRNLYTRFWDVVPLLPTGGFQVPITVRGEEIFALDEGNNIVSGFSTQTLALDRNYFVDLRTGLSSP